MPHHLQTSGVGWLVASVVLVAMSIAVFAGGLRGLAVGVTVVDDAVVRWLAGLDAPGLEGTWRVLAFLSSWWVLNALGLGLVQALDQRSAGRLRLNPPTARSGGQPA